jgi:hypothetical protein
MISTSKNWERAEFGDFQTPKSLADAMVDLINEKSIVYRTVVDPTCGLGNILFAATENLVGLKTALGVEIKAEYVKIASSRENKLPVSVIQADFFELDLKSFTSKLEEPYIFIGNPPWITNSSLSSLDSTNVPKKENYSSLSGFDALTGKSNFDISEWILLQLLKNISGTQNACAMLVKTGVARKIISYAASNNLAVQEFEIYNINAKEEFGVSVSACLLFFKGCRPSESNYSYASYTNIIAEGRLDFIYFDGNFVKDKISYERTQIYHTSKKAGWRSGIKHDSSAVMELRHINGILLSANGGLLDLEPDLIYPILKSSDIAKGNTSPRLFTIVTQNFIGEDTNRIEHLQPKTWGYLYENLSAFKSRKSSIYRNKPLFSIFGVGSYSFSPYKIAISGMYKTIKFTLIEPYKSKCVMVDDTCYFLGFDNRYAALITLAALESPIAQEYFTSRIHWDEKRPIKKDLLDSFNIELFIATNFKDYNNLIKSYNISEDEFDKFFGSI